MIVAVMNRPLACRPIPQVLLRSTFVYADDSPSGCSEENGMCVDDGWTCQRIVVHPTTVDQPCSPNREIGSRSRA